MTKESTCNFDHSTKGQENCQHLFLQLAKRNISDHANLTPYSKPIKDATATSTGRSFQLSQTQQTHRPSVTTTQHSHFTPTPNRYGSK